MEDFEISYVNFLDSQLNSSLESEAFIQDISQADYSSQFTTDDIFSTREELIKWVRGVAFRLGFVVIILRSDKYNGQPGRKTYVLLACERSGKYKKYKPDAEPSLSGTRKCECPFKLRGKPISKGMGWTLKVICGYHNHQSADTLVGHPFAGRMNPSEKQLLVDMTNSQVKPANILLTLKGKDESNVSTMKQVYNARHRYKRSVRGSRTELQQLMVMLERDNYIYFCRCVDESDVVSDLFWAHPDAVKLLNAFNIVFLMDTTYKTNKYRLPLLEIVGVTSTGLTFSAAFAFLSSERENNFKWALERFETLFMTSEGGPQVIVSDRDLAVMNSIATVFPQCYHLLCRFHIQKNVQAKCKMLVNSVEAWEVVLQAWYHVMDCEDEDKFGDCVNRLKGVCQPWPLFWEYVNDSWITPYKKYFVKAWTNEVMHLGNTTSNRVESAHASLKKVLGSSMGDLCSCWDGIHNVIILQHNEVRASFEKSRTLSSINYKALSYRRLIGYVSRYALGLLAQELERVKNIGFDTSRCGCVLRKTHGLPCACELARYDPGMIPIQEIHVMWTRLSFSDISSTHPEAQLCIQREVELVLKQFQEVDIAGKVSIKQKLLDIVCPSMTSMVPPATRKIKTKGAPRSHRGQRSTKRDLSYFEHVDAFVQKSTPTHQKESMQQVKIIPMIEQFHPICQPYIIDVVDVIADGHCGYRCIAALLGMGEDSWPLIRHDLYKELSQWRDEYATLVGSYERLEELRKSLLVDSQLGANQEKWMTVPDMGYAIANRYNVILVCLSSVQNMTIFPLRTAPPTQQSQHRLICIGHVYGSHFVQVHLKEGCPIPMVDFISSTHCYPQAKAWSTYYGDRMQAFMDLMGVTRSFVDLSNE